MTGVMYSVSNCEKNSPPTTATPSGRRDSAPAPMPKRDRQRAHQRRHRGHHDRPEAHDAALEDRLGRALALGALRVEREVDHHDGVFLHQADQHDDADEGEQVELHVERSSA